MIRQSTSVTGTPTSETTPTPTEDRVRVEIVDKGYMDDPLNTDNCWKEVELWSVHYTPESNENISVGIIGEQPCNAAKLCRNNVTVKR